MVSNSPETIKREKLLSQIFFLLRQINKPYLIVIKGNTLKTISDEDELIGSISDWLELGGDPVFDYGDNKVGHLVLEAKKMPGFSNVEILSSSEFSFVNPKIFRRPLKQKSKQHKMLRKQGFPYIIALFIEPFLFSAEEVVEAWLGKHEVIIDTSGKEFKILEERVDLSGLHFFGKKVLHTTVSGTLVFKRKWEHGKFGLESFWIENPVAKVKVNPSIFPTKSNWMVTKITKTGVEMAWLKNN